MNTSAFLKQPVTVGSLSECAQILQPNEATDGVGEPLDTPSIYANVSCRVEFLSGRDLELAQKIANEASAIVTTRYRRDWLMPETQFEKMTFFWNSVSWNILAVLPTEHKRFMCLLISRTN